MPSLHTPGWRWRNGLVLAVEIRIGDNLSVDEALLRCGIAPIGRGVGADQAPSGGLAPIAVDSVPISLPPNP